ncbi:MAG: hypothetical protein AB7U82_28735 [Blastocatellales bacterium]
MTNLEIVVWGNGLLCFYNLGIFLRSMRHGDVDSRPYFRSTMVAGIGIMALAIYRPIWGDPEQSQNIVIFMSLTALIATVINMIAMRQESKKAPPVSEQPEYPPRQKRNPLGLKRKKRR